MVATLSLRVNGPMGCDLARGDSQRLAVLERGATIGRMTQPNVSDAEARYLEEIAKDCERVLGAGVEIEPLELEIDGDVVLRLRYSLATVAGTSEGRGPNLLAAHADLRHRLVEDRLALGFRAVVFS